jgi:hypothetical protein
LQSTDWEIKVAEASAKHADWDDVMTVAETVRLPAVCIKALEKTTDGPELMYHFGKHPEDADRILALPPAQALREMFTLKNKVLGAPVKVVSSAPAPIAPPRNGSAPVEKQLKDMSMQEFYERERAKKGLPKT